VLQLLKVSDNWTDSVEIGGNIDVIYTDLEKAFDKVAHRRLISLNQRRRVCKVARWLNRQSEQMCFQLSPKRV
jgi:hypothetical protein